MANPKGNPANLRPFPPGVSGNPVGRPAAGATVREWVNVLTERKVLAPQLRAISRDDRVEPAKRAAAIRILRMVEDPDLGDFADALEGGATLGELKKRGMPTHVVKRLRVKQRTVMVDEQPVTETTREIELHDRSGEDFDRILDRTEGKPRQTVAVEQSVPMAIEIVTPRRRDRGTGRSG